MALDPPSTARERKIATALNNWIFTNPSPEKMIELWRVLNAAGKQAVLDLIKAPSLSAIDDQIAKLTARRGEIDGL